MCRRDHESADALQTDAVGSTFGQELAKRVVEPVGGPPGALDVACRRPLASSSERLRCGSRVVGTSREGLAEASRRTEPAPRITLTGRYQSALPDPLPERGADRPLKSSAPDAAVA
jgi:hypothetical protein